MRLRVVECVYVYEMRALVRASLVWSVSTHAERARVLGTRLGLDVLDFTQHQLTGRKTSPPAEGNPFPILGWT